jgi:hypothetical protein
VAAGHRQGGRRVAARRQRPGDERLHDRGRYADCVHSPIVDGATDSFEHDRFNVSFEAAELTPPA